MGVLKYRGFRLPLPPEAPSSISTLRISGHEVRRHSSPAVSGVARLLAGGCNLLTHAGAYFSRIKSFTAHNDPVHGEI